MATVATTAKPYVAAAGPPAAVTTAAASQHRGADDSDAGQDPLTTNPVGHRREERCEQRCGSHAGGRDGADRGNATVAERHDTERDHERALARPHRSERDLGAAERPAVRHLAERARPIAEPRRETSHHARLSQMGCPGFAVDRHAGARTPLGFDIIELSYSASGKLPKPVQEAMNSPRQSCSRIALLWRTTLPPES